MIFHREGGGRATARQGGVRFAGRGDRIGFSGSRDIPGRLHCAACPAASPCAQSRALYATSRSAGRTPSGPGARTSLTGELSESSFWPYPIIYSPEYIVYVTPRQKRHPSLKNHPHSSRITDDLIVRRVKLPPYFHRPLNCPDTQRFGLRFTQDKEGL